MLESTTMNKERYAKQVIVMRTDLGMRKGKMIAQGAHASMAWMSQIWHYDRRMTDAESAWINGSFTKVCVRVDSEDELVAIHEAAIEAGLESHLITDAGKTESHGIPTMTCLAIGPDWADVIDEITGHLKLL